MIEWLARRRFGAMDLIWILASALLIEHGHPFTAACLIILAPIVVCYLEAQL